METLLTRSADPNAIIGFLRDRGFDVRLVLYLRNQPQLFNSAYAQRVKTFRYAGEFVPTVEQMLRQPSSRYATWLEVADRNRCELTARPFTSRVRAEGPVADSFQPSACRSPSSARPSWATASTNWWDRARSRWPGGS